MRKRKLDRYSEGQGNENVFERQVGGDEDDSGVGGTEEEIPSVNENDRDDGTRTCAYERADTGKSSLLNLDVQYELEASVAPDELNQSILGALQQAMVDSIADQHCHHPPEDETRQLRRLQLQFVSPGRPSEVINDCTPVLDTSVSCTQYDTSVLISFDDVGGAMSDREEVADLALSKIIEDMASNHYLNTLQFQDRSPKITKIRFVGSRFLPKQESSSGKQNSSNSPAIIHMEDPQAGLTSLGIAMMTVVGVLVLAILISLVLCLRRGVFRNEVPKEIDSQDGTVSAYDDPSEGMMEGADSTDLEEQDGDNQLAAIYDYDSQDETSFQENHINADSLSPPNFESPLKRHSDMDVQKCSKPSCDFCNGSHEKSNNMVPTHVESPLWDDFVNKIHSFDTNQQWDDEYHSSPAVADFQNQSNRSAFTKTGKGAIRLSGKDQDSSPINPKRPSQKKVKFSNSSSIVYGRRKKKVHALEKQDDMISPSVREEVLL